MNELFKKVIKTEDLQIYKLKEVSTIKKDSRGRKVKEEVIHMDIKDNDNYLTTVLKNIINNANITNKELYDKVGSRSKGYSLMYSLNRNISGVTWETIQLWADILELDIDISVKPRDKK